ncbi:hypothetical protein MRB53_021183 [Persea americana]|uniref:Uncharacterized protein n=1 Tax=Persea americana TaxID=3435 RepID=A0ACC2L3X3_PERAE|nr:hypothetical protein MRB53_021183 [Persea americana]
MLMASGSEQDGLHVYVNRKLHAVNNQHECSRVKKVSGSSAAKKSCKGIYHSTRACFDVDEIVPEADDANDVVSATVDANDVVSPTVDMLEKRHLQSLNFTSRLTPYAKQLMSQEAEETRRLHVRVAILVEFQVQSAAFIDIVDLEQKKCSFRR